LVERVEAALVERVEIPLVERVETRTPEGFTDYGIGHMG